MPCEKKLDHVGDRSRFDTDKVKWYEENETGGLTTCYTDHITRQPMFKAVLTTNIAPFCTNPEIDTKETRVIRSWNDDYRCLTCTGDRAQHPVLAREKLSQICKACSKEPKEYAVAQNAHGALTLLQKPLGTGLTSEGAAGYTFAMQRSQVT